MASAIPKVRFSGFLSSVAQRAMWAAAFKEWTADAVRPLLAFTAGLATFTPPLRAEIEDAFRPPVLRA